MSYGIILRVTHAGANALNSSVYLPDTHDGKDSNGRVQNQRSAQYVPVGGYVDLVFSDQVAFSYQQGGIRGLINEGYISTSFIVNTDFSDGITSLGTLTTPLVVNSFDASAVEDGEAISVATQTSYLVIAAAGDEATLANGSEGQIKILVAKTVAAGGDMVVTVANAGWDSADGGTSGKITFDAKGDACTLQFVQGAWYCIGNNGCVFSN